MEQRIYHGILSIDDLTRAVVGHFNRGNYRVQDFCNQGGSVIQIATSRGASSGGATSLTISMEKVTDGISIKMGSQNWLGTAASIGQTAFSVFLNPWNLINRLDDIAQDIENVQLTAEVWNVIEETARERNSNFQLSERLKRITCSYCGSANPVGESNCVACGAPLGQEHPTTCPYCGFVVRQTDQICPNCSKSLIRK
jgi:DNA-directed RNA polymerase subunit RPC12/RpoP